MKSITVAELKELLENWEDEAMVIFATNYGDRGQTQQAHPIRGHLEEVTLRKSGYSESGYAIHDDLETMIDNEGSHLLLS